MGSSLAFALQLLQSLPPLIAAGVNVANMVKDGTAALQTMQNENRDPTAMEWDRLNGTIKQLRGELHAD